MIFLILSVDSLRLPALGQSCPYKWLVSSTINHLCQYFRFDLHQHKTKNHVSLRSKCRLSSHCCWQWPLPFEERARKHRILLLLNDMQISDRISWNLAILWLTLGEIQCHGFRLQRRTQYPQNGWTSCETSGHNNPIPFGKRRQSESSPMITNSFNLSGICLAGLSH